MGAWGSTAQPITGIYESKANYFPRDEQRCDPVKYLLELCVSLMMTYNMLSSQEELTLMDNSLVHLQIFRVGKGMARQKLLLESVSF